MLTIAAVALAAGFCCAGRLAAGHDVSRPLYRFHATKDDVTHVMVGNPDRDAPRIDPRVFSNFLEHLGGAVYEGLWANCVYNPNFYREGTAAPVRWTLADGASADEAGPADSSLLLPQGASARQLVSIPAHRELRYQGSLITSVPSGSSCLLEVRLRRVEKPADLAVVRLRASGTAWASRRLRLVLPEGALARGEPAELVLTALTGACRLADVQVFPADAIAGMDPDVVRASRSLRIELLRWPGGNFASGYHWRRGVGPRDARPTLRNPAWGGLETHHFGTDEYMRFCREIGAKPQICVNAGSGTAAEAAAWVEYCNGAPGTPMGTLRAANGHRQPYNVRVWEIGNELYGGWQIGHTDAAGNARRFVEFRAAMLRSDPTIEVIATGKGDQYVGGGLAFDDAWNAAVLDAARASGQPAPRYLSVHPLVPLPEGLAGRYSYEQVYESALAHPQWWLDRFIPDTRRLLHEHAGGGAATAIAPTEWGIIVGGPQWIRYPNHDTMSGAAYAALWFHAMFRAADVVGLSNATALLHGGGIARPNAVTIVYPMYHVQRMYGAARPTRLLPTDVSGPGQDVPQRGFMPAASVPDVDVQAAEGHGTRLVFLVNRDIGSARRVEVSLPSRPGRATIETLSADPRQGNTRDEPDRVRPRSHDLTITGRTLSLELPPCSVSVITFR